mgnify:CR=1 FL=1
MTGGIHVDAVVNPKVAVLRNNRKTEGPLYNIWRYKELFIMLLPTLLYFLIFRYGPIFGIIIAFQDFRPIAGSSFIQSILDSKWVGLENFKEFFTSLNGVQIVVNTLLISFYKLIFGFPVPIILALLLNEVKNGHCKRFFQNSILPRYRTYCT